MIELLIEAERALSGGGIDRAEQLYRQVADADPHNAIALVGLGRVALERGDDLGAYLLARRALAIDPENEAARRLATRAEGALAGPGADAAGASAAGAAEAGVAAPSVAAAPSGVTSASVATGADGAGAAAPETPGSPTVTPPRRSLLDRLRRR